METYTLTYYHSAEHFRQGDVIARFEAEDTQDAFARALAEVTARYGKDADSDYTAPNITLAWCLYPDTELDGPFVVLTRDDDPWEDER